jgi:hypothetical protein
VIKKRALTDRGSPLQDLLDEEAELANTGRGDSSERQHLHTIIRLKRSEFAQPHCFGEDDCSTLMLSKCPWRMDCGS